MIDNQQIYQVLFPFYENYLALDVKTFTLSDPNIQNVVKAALEKELIDNVDKTGQTDIYQFTKTGLKFMASQDNSWDAF